MLLAEAKQAPAAARRGGRRAGARTGLAWPPGGLAGTRARHKPSPHVKVRERPPKRVRIEKSASKTGGRRPYPVPVRRAGASLSPSAGDTLAYLE